jgi:hypothetical protein
MDTRKRFLPLVALYFLVVGSVMLVQAVRLSAEERRFVTTAAHAEGTVTGYRRSSSSISYRPGSPVPAHAVVRFVTASGDTITFVSGYGSTQPSYPIGGRVAVLYDPNDSRNAEVEGSLSEGTIVLGLMGLLAVGMSALVLFLLRRRAGA